MGTDWYVYAGPNLIVRYNDKRVAVTAEQEGRMMDDVCERALSDGLDVTAVIAVSVWSQE